MTDSWEKMCSVFVFFFSFAFSLEDPWLGLLEEVGAAKCLVAA